ncbi:MAG: hypothetical protein H6502_02065 [Candidatus Woesearchaeota archaeon]|nr:MAG: hypothetical protein H6502_02065 [Candidatus Woesearchaeota archaeon]
MNKSQISLQFVWIFVFIIGALIIAGVVSFIFRANDASEEAINFEFISKIQPILLLASHGTDSAKEINIPNVPLSFTCLPGLSTLQIENAPPTDITYLPFYSLDHLESPKLALWGLPHTYPFITSTLLLVSTRRVDFVFYESLQNGPLKELHDRLPDIYAKQYVTSTAALDAISLTSYDHYRIIALDGVDSQTVTEHLPLGDKVTLLSLPHAPFTYPGTAYLADQPFRYLSQELLFAAMFSQDAQTYRCQTQKLFHQASLAYQLHLARLNSLTVCPGSYESAKLQLQTLIDTTDADVASLAKDALMDENARLSRLGCPLVY